MLEIGNGRASRRGRFLPPVEEAEAWVYLDLANEQLPHVQADVEHLPLKDIVFDTVVCLEVLEYAIHPQAALSEIRRVLKHDGKLILATPFLHRTDTSHDYWRFTEHSLRHLLAEAGFGVQQLKAQGAALAVAVNILKYAIYAMPNGRRRNLAVLVAYLPLMALFRLDEPVARRLPVLRTFSTGYVILAKGL
ncbi:MAG: class I SAM-dependent methyltransferase [Chloroflexi bacterium]|nr:class I SAM-dependent methyltransferase [Chloroflexota bacterium]